MLEALARVGEYTSGMSFDAFCADPKTVDAVARNISIVGEAAQNVSPVLQGQHPRVPWAQMRGMRNVLIHRYFEVSLLVLWDTATHDVPILAPLVQDILEPEE